MRRGVDETVAAGTLHAENGAGFMPLALKALDPTGVRKPG